MSDSTERNVGIFPDWRQNPYLDDMRAALSRHGYRLSFPSLADSRLSFYKGVRRSGVDLVHLHWQHPFLLSARTGRTMLRGSAFLAQVAMLKGSGIPLVWTIHNVVSHERRSVKAERVLSALLYRLVDIPTVHCQSAAVSVRSAYGLTKAQAERLISVPHGNYDRSYGPLPGKTAARRRLNLDPSSFLYLHFGAVRGYKKVELVAESFVNMRDDQAQLMVAGRIDDDEVGGKLIDLAERDHRIRLDSCKIPDEDLPTYFAAADVFVYAAPEILMSGAVMLAMTFGLPIVAPSVGCLPSVVPDDGVRWFAPDDAGDLTRALREVRGMDLESMGVSNRRAAERCSWDRIGARWAEIYDTLLTRRGSQALRYGAARAGDNPTSGSPDP